MSIRKWYSPTRYLVKGLRYIVRKSNNPIVFLLGCTAYAVMDIYGVTHAPQVFRWLVVEINKARKQQNARTKK